MFLTFIRLSLHPRQLSFHSDRILRTQVLDGTITFDVDYMVFVAPNPKLKPKFFALVWPLTPTLWVFVFISLAVGTAVFTLVSNLESQAGSQWDGRVTLL